MSGENLVKFLLGMLARVHDRALGSCLLETSPRDAPPRLFLRLFFGN